MKQFGKRLTALALAAVMALGLAACGGKEGDGDGQKLSGTVYVPQFLDCKLPVDYVNSGCVAGDKMYIIGVKGEETPATDTDSETGETYEYTRYTETYILCKVSLTDGTVEELTGYTPPGNNPDDPDSGGYVESIRALPDGTLWLQENSWAYIFDLPEDFDPETDDKWNYMSDYQDQTYLRHLDADGSELENIDLTALAEKLEISYFGNYLFDRDGNLWVLSDNKLLCLDGEWNERFRLEAEENPEDGSSYSGWERVVQLGDGRIGVLIYSYAESAASPEGEASYSYGYTLQAVDPETQDWAEETYPLAANVYNIFSGGGDYLFYYQNNDTIYGYKAGAKEGERIFSWIEANINNNNVDFFEFLSDGRVCALTRDWESDEPKVELALLSATDASTLPEKTTLSYATMWLNYDTRRKIIDFNKSSEKYRIDVKDYSEFNTQDDYEAGLKKLNTEIMSGSVPDILDTSGLPFQRFGQRGYLEDLWPFIENDPDLGREGVMEHVLEAASQEGKLYHLFDSFAIKTVAGAKNAVGDRTSWTLADMQAALAAMPEGCLLFGQGYTKSDMLNEVLTMNLNSFVDWSTGKCSFDSGNFKALLEFCNSFPDVYDWEAEEARMKEAAVDAYYDESVYMMEGKQLLQGTYLYNLGRVTRQRTLLEKAGGVSYVGYPMEDGSCGSSFRIAGSSMAISSTCADKEGAWSFVRQLILPQEESQRSYWGTMFVNKKDFEKMAKDAMTPSEEFDLDENGEQILGPDGQPLRAPKDWCWISDGQEIKIYESTQADYDQLMALYNATTTFDNRDESIYEIVADDAAAYFAGDKDLDAVVSQIQSRVYLYVNEQM